MPCRVGITTNPSRRKAEWESLVIGFRNWMLVAKFNTRNEAQTFEDQYAKQHGCEAHPGGDDAPGTWYVYYFEFDRDR